MRDRNLIEKDGTRKDILAVEILLDIRDLLNKGNISNSLLKETSLKLNKKPRGRPKKKKEGVK